MASMFVTFTAPHHTSTSATLDPHRNPSNRDSSKKDKPARQRERKERNRDKPTGNRKKGHHRVPAKKDTNDEGRFQNGHCHLDVRCFTASSFWRQSWRWRRQADLGPAQRTGGWHCLLCFLVSLQRIRKAWWDWVKNTQNLVIFKQQNNLKKQPRCVWRVN